MEEKEACESVESQEDEDALLKEAVNGLSASERLDECEKKKLEGSEQLQRGDFENALSTYNVALKYITLHEPTKADEKSEGKSEEKPDNYPDKEKSLHLTCLLNIALVHIKLKQFPEAIQSASSVLDIQPDNIKALFRRGSSHANVGNLEEAKKDFLKCLDLDPSNCGAKTELLNVNQKIKAHKESTKKAFSGLFEKSLYDDKEKERLLKLAREEEDRKLRREQWHNEMNKRQKEGSPEVSFDDWWAEEEKKIKKKNEEDEKERVEKQKRNVSGTKLSGGVCKVEHDEEDEQILNETKKMGYCYFRRDLTEEEKIINSKNAPKKIDEIVPESEKVPARAISSWNSKGTTYEEKDTSTWCAENFKKILKKIEVESRPDMSDMSAFSNLLDESAKEGQQNPSETIAKLASKFITVSMKCTKVKEVTGEGHISVLRGTRRYLFDLNATMEFAMKVGTISEGEVSYEGEIKLTDVTSASQDDLEFSLSFISPPQHAHQTAVDEIVEKFKESILNKTEEFLCAYRASA